MMENIKREQYKNVNFIIREIKSEINQKTCASFEKGIFMKKLLLGLVIFGLTVSSAFVSESVSPALFASAPKTPSPSAADPLSLTPEGKEIKTIVEEKAPVIIDLNRSVWEFAETRYKEFKSAAKIISVLESEGFTVEKETAGIKTAFRAVYGSGSPTVGFLAEYDALSNLGQQAGSPVKKPVPGRPDGHGCGHSVLGAAAVGGAIAVKEYLKKHPMKGTIVLYGTPAEEGGCGKTFMAKRGCFRELDIVFSWHPSTGTSIATGRSLANYKVKYTFEGISAHASGSPDKGRSALDAGELMNVGVNYLREHMSSFARIHYAWLNCGGDAPNVVQDHTELLYYIRSPKLSDCDLLIERVHNIARGAALMTDTKLTIKILGGLSDYLTNSVAASVLDRALQEMGAPSFGEKEFALARQFMTSLYKQDERQILTEKLAKKGKMTAEEFAQKPLDRTVGKYNPNAPLPISLGSTDDGDVSQIVPAARFNMTNTVPGSRGHSWEVTAQSGSCIGDCCAQGAARVFARAALLVFQHPEIVKPAKEELLRTTKGKYKSPIPNDAVPGEF